ncbi:MAG TPA: alanine racemase [Rectinemataceae bacterium]|nr:alanine racemase [Rectinemataceae bacterium]
MDTTRQAWAEIDLSAIRANAARLLDLASPRSRLCAVVKADAYGHGAVEVARAALAGGASHLAVALLAEALALREAGIAAPILLLGAVRPEEAEAAVAADLEASVFDEAAIEAFDRAGRRAGKKALLHLKIETGMSRVGCEPSEAPGLAARIASLPGTTLAGAYSHFANADDEDLSFAREQLGRYSAALEAIAAAGLAPPLRHIANSAATLWMPESRLDMVRAGIALYGLNPASGHVFDRGFLPALSIRARVVRLRTIEAGTTVSYGRTWTAPRRTRLATIPLGYADGYPRIISGRSWAGAGGARLAQVGRVCMDMCMFDATDAPEVVEGSELILAGPGGPSLDEIAELAHTINYEIACHAALRLPRVYVGAAEVAAEGARA